MPEFRARLATANGEIVVRDYTAQSADGLRRDLEKQDYLVLGLQRRSALLSFASDLASRKRKIDQKEFLLFNQEFGALIKAGLPITECLQLLMERRKNPDFKAALEDVRDRVKSGEALSDAFEAQDAFPALYSSALASGERSGEIAAVLERYVAYTTTLLNVRKKVIGAFVYPIILVLVAALVITVLMVFVLPNFKGLFVDAGADLPTITVIVVGVSDFLVGYWMHIALGVLGLVVAMQVWKRTPAGRRALEALLYKIPFVGSIARRFVITRFARTLSSLVAGGIPLVSCLEVLARSIGTPIYSSAIDTIADRIREGAALWSSMEDTGLFGDTLVGMVKVGESSGSLPEMLGHVADFTDHEIEQELQTVVTLIEPIMLIFMAVIVATIVLALFLPLIQLYSSTQF